MSSVSFGNEDFRSNNSQARCTELVAANFGCDPATNCVCTQPTLETSLQACFIAICPPMDMYMSQAVFAQVCDRPVRDRSVITGATTYVLYGIATMFTLARFLSRNEMFGGAGYVEISSQLVIAARTNRLVVL